jgi:type IV pilus assembly protein PilC
MIFNYKAIDNTGVEREGTIEAINIDVAINSLQRRGLIISTIKSPDEVQLFFRKTSTFSIGSATKTSLFCLARCRFCLKLKFQLFECFDCLHAEAENQLCEIALMQVADDLQGGSSISKALQKHPIFFQTFMSTWFAPVKNRESSMKFLVIWPTTSIDHMK